MLNRLQENRPLQLALGFLLGIPFGFFLQKSQVTRYDAIFGQLIFQDFTVIKVMFTAILVGMPGIYLMRRLGWVELHIKPGAVGSTVIGSLIFGVGLAILGYCPGTTIGAVGQGSLDALCGGVTGMLAGAATYANAIYPKLQERSILDIGDFGKLTIPEWLGVRPSTAVLIFILFGMFLFTFFERFGL
jgi:hypothetical protein